MARRQQAAVTFNVRWNALPDEEEVKNIKHKYIVYRINNNNNTRNKYWYTY